jgi:hypothetical protein
MKRLGFLVLVLVVACVGPARTDRVYVGKAVETAKSVRSAIETARLAALGASKGKATVSYLSVVLGEAESEADSASGAFDSIQPPSDRSESLHDSLADLIDKALDGLRAMRVAARRSEPSALPALARDLAPVSKQLESFIEEHE